MDKRLFEMELDKVIEEQSKKDDEINKIIYEAINKIISSENINTQRCIIILIEEINELIMEYTLFKCGMHGYNSVLEEIADVLISIEAFSKLLNLDVYYMKPFSVCKVKNNPEIYLLALQKELCKLVRGKVNYEVLSCKLKYALDAVENIIIDCNRTHNDIKLAKYIKAKRIMDHEEFK